MQVIVLNITYMQCRPCQWFGYYDIHIKTNEQLVINDDACAYACV